MSGSEIDDYCELGKNGAAMKSFHPSHGRRPERTPQARLMERGNEEARSESRENMR